MRTLTEADAPMHYCLFDTAIGTVGVAWSAHGMTRLQLPEVESRCDRAAVARTLGQRP